MTITSLDDAAWDSPWRRRPVGEKVALSTALLLTSLCTPSMEASSLVSPVVGSGIWPGALLAGIVSMIVILGPARIQGRVLWQAMAAPIVFLFFGGISVLISLGSSPVGTVWWHSGVFSIGPVSTAQAMSLVEHGVCGTLTLMVLAVTTPMVDLLTWMRKFHIPDPLLEIASLTYRLIFVLLDTLVTASEAQHARLGDAPEGRFGGFNRRAAGIGGYSRLDKGQPPQRRPGQPRIRVRLGDPARQTRGISTFQDHRRHRHRCCLGDQLVDDRKDFQMSDEVLLSTEHLYATHPGRPMVLTDVNVTFRAGVRVAILGANGSGKTTLMRCLSGSLKPVKGKVKRGGTVLGHGRTQLREHRRAVQLVLQDPDDQLFSADVSQDVSFGPMNMGLDVAEVRDRVAEALQLLGASHLAERATHQLSYGERKRIAVAGAVAMRPDLLLLDEPTAGLDPVGVTKMLEALDRLRDHGTTVAMATHDVDLALAWADEALIVVDGGVRQGPIDELLANVTMVERAHLHLPWPLELVRRLGIDERPRTMSEVVAILSHRPPSTSR